MRVIGTAGHVDHGKSTLVHALTGTHPDRLKEEQDREMTIVLGFAWWQLANGEEVGVIDVPGHRDFIENMLSGVGGIDAALFVIAADEGVMPQTREHLAILDLLQVPAGVVALTKTDLVEDPEWLELVIEEVRRIISGTSLKNAPIIPVSAKNGKGLDELQIALQAVLAEQPHRADLARPRLPVDRVFTKPGFGTVVTGTLVDGSFKIGDEVVSLPGGYKGRVRGLQTHNRKEEAAYPGARTAVNISGIDVDQIQRGEVITLPGLVEPTRRIDVKFRLLPGAAHPLKHDDEVKFFVGASEMIARTRLLGSEQLTPGEEAWLQLELRDPVVVVRGDRFILRRPSPGETIGGGVVLDPHPAKRHKRFDEQIISRLEALTGGAPADVLLQTLLAHGLAPYSLLVEQSNLAEEDARQAAEELIAAGQVLTMGSEEKLAGKTLLAAAGYWSRMEGKVLDGLKEFHRSNRLRAGMSREELKSRLGVDNQTFTLLTAQLAAGEKIIEQGPHLRLPDHQIEFSAQEKEKVAALIARFAQAPFAPPTVKDALADVGENVYQAMVDLGELLPVSNEVVFRPEDYQKALSDVRQIIQDTGSITLAQARDHWSTTRRYVQALLEYMDGQGITVRQGEARILRERRK